LLACGVFRELQDDAYFRQVRAEGGTVVWPHEQDICPDTLYMVQKADCEQAAAAHGVSPPLSRAFGQKMRMKWKE